MNTLKVSQLPGADSTGRRCGSSQRGEGERSHPGLPAERLAGKQTRLISITGRKPGARVQLLTRELQGMATMQRQNVFAACRTAARASSLGCQHWERALCGVAWLCQGCGMQGAKEASGCAPTGLQLCRWHRTCWLCAAGQITAAAQSSARARNAAQVAG